MIVVLLSGLAALIQGQRTAAANNLAYYYLPFPVGVSHTVTQGNGGTFSHTGIAQYAWDFGGDGFPVYSARAGKVVGLKDSYASAPSCNKAYENMANYVVIRTTESNGANHDALYLHLKQGSATAHISNGNTYPLGTMIGNSDSTGYVCGPHLHFMVMNPCSALWWCQSVPSSFRDGTVLYQHADGVPRVNDVVRAASATGIACTSGTSYLLGFTSIPFGYSTYTTHLDIALYRYVSGSYWCWMTQVFTEDNSPFTMTGLNVSYWCGTGARHSYFASGTASTGSYYMASGNVATCSSAHADDAAGSYGTRIATFNGTFDKTTTPSTYVHYP